MSDDPGPVVDLARESFGGSLRAVIRHRIEEGSPTGTLAYAREDVAESDRDSEFATALARDYSFESIEREWHEQLHGAGRLRASVRVFEEAVEIRVHGEEEGHSIHVDPDAIPNVSGFVERLRAR